MKKKSSGSRSPVTDLIELEREYKKVQSISLRSKLTSLFIPLLFLIMIGGIISVILEYKQIIIADYFEQYYRTQTRSKPFSVMFARPDEFVVEFFTDSICRGKQYRIRLIHKPSGIKLESEPIVKRHSHYVIERLFIQIRSLLEAEGYRITFVPIGTDIKEEKP